MKRKLVAAMSIVLILMVFGQSAWSKTIYVDSGATGANTGANWVDAYKYLQDAISTAVANDEIRIAAGVYWPDMGTGYVSGDRAATFTLKNLVRLKGGYPAGGGTTSDWNANKTYLSGDLKGNDATDTLVQNLLTDPTRADNSYHVISSNLCGSPTSLDGLIITGGQANGADSLGNGGGWYNTGNSSPMITNCLFTYNAATTRGGGWYNDGVNCKPTLTNVSFTHNLTTGSGGAVAMIYTGADVKLIGCQFSENRAATNAGAIHLDISSPKVKNCVFSSNYASAGGAIYSNNTCSTVIENTNFTGNSATNNGGAVCTANNLLSLYMCVFESNTAYNGGAVFTSLTSMAINNCVFESNSAENGGAVYTSANSLAMNDCMFEFNTASSGGAIYYPAASSIQSQITRCQFLNNHTHSQGGAIYNSGGKHNLVSCKFIGNYSASHGGAIYNQWTSYLTGWNCLFVGNYVANSGSGGAVASFYGGQGIIFINSTFYGNTSISAGGAFYTDYESSTNTLINCILYRNADSIGGNYSESAQIYGGTNTIRSSCIQGLSAYAGNGNIGNDPGFVNPLGDDWIIGNMDDDLHLAFGSPCIDTGDNSLVPVALATDLDGYLRTMDGNSDGTTTVDMGVYEYNTAVMPIIPDPALRAAVEDVLGVINPDATDMLGLTSLAAKGLNISSLVGLEYATNLVNLDLQNNNITDLSPLTCLTTLRELRIQSNSLLTLESYQTCIPQIIANNPLMTVFLYDQNCNKTLLADANKDCVVNLVDLALMAKEWLKCDYIYQELCQ